MKSVFWLIPDSVAGRPGPKKEPWVLSELRKAGFDAVLNLSEFEPDHSAFKSAGITLSWVPLPTDVPPTEAAERQCEEALPRAFTFLTTQINAGKHVLVHCNAGRDRTGMLLALLLAKREALSVREAIRKVRVVRPTAITSVGWEDLAVRVIPRIVSKI